MMMVPFAPISQLVVQQVKFGLLQLTPAEYDVLRHMMAGGSDAEIAEAVGISHRTAAVHLQSIRRKTGHTRYRLMRAAFELRNDKELRSYLEHLPQKHVGRPSKRSQATTARSPLQVAGRT